MAWAIRKGRKNNRCSKEFGLHCQEVLQGMDEAARTGATYELQSRCEVRPLTPGFFSSNSGMRGDAERSIID